MSFRWPSSAFLATDSAHGRVVPAVFLVSAAAMAYEIFLIRLLSMRFWPHFVPLVISQAMLGYGASGVFLHLFRGRIGKAPQTAFAWSVLFAAPSFDLAFRASRTVPFDPFLLLWEPSSWAGFALLFCLLSVPFFLAGASVGVPLSFRVGSVGLVYASGFAGSAAGALLSVASLPLAPAESLLRVPLALGLLASGFVLADPGGRVRPRRAFWLCLCLPILAVAPPDPAMSPYKDLAVARRLPDAETLSRAYGTSGDYRALYSPGIHSAPGLSIRFEGDIPPQAAVFADGELRGVVPRDGGLNPPAYLGFLPAALPYRMTSGPSVLQFGLRGTEGILMAARNGASSVTVVEQSPALARMIEEDLERFSGGMPRSLGVEILEGGGRSFLARRGKRFDLIELADISSPTFSSLGIHATGETYLLTREGIRAALSRLSPDGILAVSGWRKSPPRESVKILETIRAEMAVEAGEEVKDRFVVIRGWGSFVLAAGRGPFGEEEIGMARRFCEDTGFRMVWPQEFGGPGTEGREEEAFREAVTAILDGKGERMEGSGPFDLRPVTDDSPYFHRFLRLRFLPEFRRLIGPHWIPLVEWGVLFLLLSLAVSSGLAAVFVLLPLLFAGNGNPGGKGRVAVYFASLGTAYMLVELSFLKFGILILGDPVRAAAAAVGGFLLLSGAGSALSPRWEPSGALRRRVFIGIAVLAPAGFLLLFRGAPLLLAENVAVRTVAFLAALSPAAFLMGIPFPAALAGMARADSGAIPYAWAVNGFFSVAGASLAPAVSLWAGFHAAVAAGAVLYLLAWSAFPVPAGART